MTKGATDRGRAVDELYQLPLDEFTAARNALAKGATDAADIRALQKPPLAAWAVNQLYWRDRATWDALIDAAENLRTTHKSVLSGRAGDVRAAGAAHDAAVQDALKSTLNLLEQSGHPATDAVRQAVTTTLRALPADDAPGRLTRVLQPGGFEMLAGLSIAGRAPVVHAREKTPAATPPGAKRTRGGHTKAAQTQSKADAKALTHAREAAAAAARALTEAEQTARRHEFEIARATRDEERGAKAVADAHTALDEAKKALAAAENDHRDAIRRRDTAQAAKQKADAAITAARHHAETTAAALKKINAG